MKLVQTPSLDSHRICGIKLQLGDVALSILCVNLRLLLPMTLKKNFINELVLSVLSHKVLLLLVVTSMLNDIVPKYFSTPTNKVENLLLLLIVIT